MTRHRTWGTGRIGKERLGNWFVRWNEGGRRRYQGGFQSRQLAERALAVRLGQIAFRGAGVAPDPALVPPLRDLAPDWLDRRAKTFRAAREERYRWDLHLAPAFGHLRPAEVEAAEIRAFIEAKLAEGLTSATIRVMVSSLSALFNDLVERELAATNPARSLPQSTRRLLRPTHDARTTPFLERLADVRRVFLALPERLRVAFALGAYGGLRPGEAWALRWAHVDLPARRIHVRESVGGPTKDKDSRIVPILDALLPVLQAAQLASGGKGYACPSLRRDGGRAEDNTRGRQLRAVLVKLGLVREGLGWYECTRHTFASQWVMAGGDLRRLQHILGHASIVMTERYAHLRPEAFTARDLSMIPGDLRNRAENGQSPATIGAQGAVKT